MSEPQDFDRITGNFRYDHAGDEMPDEMRPGAGRIEHVPEGMGTGTRIAAIVFMLGALAFWLFAFSPYARERFQAPDQIEDATFVIAIERRCAVAVAEMQALPSSQSVDTPRERGLLVEEANASLVRMRDDLAALPGGTEADQELISQWLGDWDFYLADRDAHSRKLLAGEDSRFLTSEVNGVFISERMSGFARRNDIRSCLPPGDL